MFNQLHYTSKIFFYYYNTFFIKCKTVILRTGFEPVRYWIQSPVPYQLGYLRLNALWRNWTHNLSVRSRTLYPIELRVLVYNILHLFFYKTSRANDRTRTCNRRIHSPLRFSVFATNAKFKPEILVGYDPHDVPYGYSNITSIDSSKRELSPSNWRRISITSQPKIPKKCTSESAVATVSGYSSNPSITVYDFRLRRE